MINFSEAEFTKWPVLKRLILIQSLIGLLGILLSIGILAYFTKQDRETSLLRTKQLIAAEIQKNQDKIIAWKILGQDAALRAYQDELIKKYDGVISTLSINPSDVSAQAMGRDDEVILSTSLPSGESYRTAIKLNLDRITAHEAINLRVYVILALSLLFFLFVIGFSLIYILHQIYRPFFALAKSFDPHDHKAVLDIKNVKARGEIYAFINNFKNLYNQNIKLEKESAIANLASQVAHDIHSPLAVLQMLLRTTQSFPEEERVLLRAAIDRIRDIVNTLSEKNRTTAVESLAETGSTQLLSPLIDRIVSEKRVQFKSKAYIQIQFEVNYENYGLFSCVEPTDFKRVLSNLINNAVEAIDAEGQVSVVLTRNSRNQNIISIQDTGKGIEKEILPNLMKRGVTFGKETGSGLGLSHAKESVESWGGALSIESQIGEGTKVVLALPQSAPPAWFVNEILIAGKRKVVVVDDDCGIHQIWDERFQKSVKNKMEILHFNVLDSLNAWVLTEDSLKENVFLVDYELIGSDKNGIEVIQAYNIIENSILVTSRYDDKKIQEECFKLGIKLIPKEMAALVPIVF